MPTLNFLIAIVIGFIIGFLVELIMEILYFRGWRRQVRDERIMQLEADLAAREEQLAQAQMDLETRDIRIIDLEGRLARGQERLNTLQRDAALQRQRAQAAAEATGTNVVDAKQSADGDLAPAALRNDEVSTPPPGGDVEDPTAAALSTSEAEAVGDAWAAAEGTSKPESWLD